MSLKQAQVDLFDCEHKTPAPAAKGVPYITIPEMRAGRLDVKSARLVAERDVPLWNRRVEPQAGDVIVSRRTNPGVSAVVPPDLRCVLGQNLVILRSRGAVIDQRFLRWLVRGPGWWQQIEKYLNVGAVFDSLRCADIPHFELAVPPLEVQRQVASILGALDDKIELNRGMSETLEAMARALFKSWFVDFEPVRAKAEGRDPGLPKPFADFFPDSFQDSVMGKVPRGWRVGTVADLCRAIFSGGTPSTQEPAYWDGGVPWLSSGETREKFIIGTERTITEAGIAHSSTRLAPAKSTVIASAGQGNTRGQASLLGFESYINQSVVALVANRDTSSPHHLFFDLERRYAEFRRISDAHSSRGSLTAKLLAASEAVLPPKPLVRSFERIVDVEVDAILGLRRQSRILAALRDALLPKLITGELTTDRMTTPGGRE